MILVLDNLRSAYNVGALFRTADGAGVSRIHLVGITPKPADPARLYRTTAEKTIEKTALGAEYAVPYTVVKTMGPLLRRLKASDCEIVALEEGAWERTIDYRFWQPKKRQDVVLIVGNEVTGLDEKVLRFADVVLNLPMRGIKNSLNVSVAAGIALYHVSDTIERQSKTVRAKK